jgi:steroid 5-alpha reductase family enzyme
MSLDDGVAMLSGWAIMAIVMLALWQRQRTTGNAGVVDVAWAFGTAAMIPWLALAADGDFARRVLIASLGALWGVRLAAHLARRVFGEAEDGRYRHMRESFGDRGQTVFFVFFQVQAGWTLLFALAPWAASASARALGWWDALGVTIWLTAMIGEAVADRQLATFRAEPSNRGRVCDVGLWRYSRHPNYFFEWIHWFAYVAIGIGSPYWWVTLAGVAMTYVFLTRLTGIPYTESQALRSRGDAYRHYQETTNAFIPGPPTNRAAEQY